MSLTSKEQRELKKFVQELENFKGRNTELVTVYIPSGYDINKILTHLSQEQGTATNIKSTATRKNVIDALERMIQHLKLFKQTPPNGLACFSGNVAEREGQSDVKVWSIEPPVALNTRIYRCDKQFLLDILREMLDVKEMYGLVVMDRRDADVAYLKGKSIVEVSNASSNVPGKTKAGGQSAARYGRIREDAAKEFYKKVSELMKDAFLGNDDVKGIIVGGPGPTKYELVESGFITGNVKDKIIAIKDLSYTGPFGLQELVERSDDVLANEEIIQEKKLMARFFELLNKQPGLVSYGYEQCKKLLTMGAVDKLLVSDVVDDSTYDELATLAEQLGSEVIIVSTETREGVQLRDIGKIAAILRYEADL
ncbi:MAG: peptide chain release factor aRF-1 [Candidatus Woesearchaeota archaeon]